MAPAAKAAAGAAPAPANSAPRPAPELVYDRLVLVRLAPDQPMKPMRLVRNGQGPYPLQYDPDRLPEGLSIDPQGVLSGTPVAEGRFDFLLRLADATGRGSEQRYRIIVRRPAGAAKPAVPPVTSLPAHSPVDLAAGPPQVARSWRLGADDMQALLAASEEEAADAAEAAPGEPPPVPTPDQLKAMIEPLQDIEFPTESQLRLALQAQVCRYYRFHVKAVAEQLARPVDDACPPRPLQPAEEAGTRPRAGTPSLHPAASRRALALLRDAEALQAGLPRPAAGAVAPPPVPATAPGKGKPLEQFYRELMTEALAHAIVQQARKLHPMPAGAPITLQAPNEHEALKGSPASCGCVPATPSDEVYGLLAHWHGDKAKQAVALGLFTRISYLGAVLEDDGSITTAYGDDKRLLDFVRQAQRHGTRVDLALHRRDWTQLRKLAGNEQAFTDYVNRAAASAVQLLSTRLDDGTRDVQRFLLPAWRESDFAFEGLTVFFDDTTREPADKRLFERFLRDFMPAVMAQMRQLPAATPEAVRAAASAAEGSAARDGLARAAGTAAAASAPAPLRPAARPFRLNLVVPDHQVLEAGPYSIDRLWSIYTEAERVLTAEQVQARRKALMSERGGAPAHQTDITVQFLVLLSEPTSDFKKLLRARLDDSRNVKGHHRVALLQSMVPVLLARRDGPAGALASDISAQLDDDFAYTRWNFGGVGLWPAPVEGRGQGTDVRELLARTYANADADSWRVGLCNWVCPKRVPLRLLMQTLLLVGLLSIGSYLVSCRVRNLGTPYQLFLLVGGMLTTALALALLSCDPALEDLRKGNAILFAVIAALFATMAWRALKPKVVLP